MVPYPFIDYRGKKTPSKKSLDDDYAHNKRASAVDIGSCCHRRETSFESHLGSNSSFGQGVPDNEDEGKTQNLQMTDEKKQVGLCPSNEDDLDSSLHSLFDDVTIVQPDELGSSVHSLFDEAPENQDVTIPLRQWLANDSRGNVMTKTSIIRKITVAYALARLVQHAPCHELERTCSIDNFDIRVSNGPSDSCGEVMGLNMLNPQLHLQIGRECCNVNTEDITGLKVTSTVYPLDNPIMDGDVQSTRDENMICHFLGLLLHNVFSGDSLVQSMPPLPQENENNENHEPSRKKRSAVVHADDFARAMSIAGSDVDSNTGCDAPSRVNLFSPLTTLGYPSSLSIVVKNLVDCGLGVFRPNESYSSVELAIIDLCLMLQEPGRYLFNSYQPPIGEPNISFLKENVRLCGRATESKLITDAFCRVASTGESEVVCE